MITQQSIYQGQYGTFSITDSDRLEVIVYRLGLWLSGLSFLAGSGLILWRGATPTIIDLLTPLLALFSLGLGISLITIHIYLKLLHRVLQLCWLIGVISGLIFIQQSNQPLGLFIYTHPLSILGIGFLFASLTGIFVKEAFCFNRLEAKLLTLTVPALLLGHLFGLLNLGGEQFLLVSWMFLFTIFIVRKATQPIPPDIGDKSVFEYLKTHKTN